MNETLGKIHFWISLIAAYGAFFPMHYAGLAGEPRHYASSLAQSNPSPTSSRRAGHHLVGISPRAVQFVFLFNLFWSARAAHLQPQPLASHHPRVVADPEPTVTIGPYEYGPVPGQTSDFHPQWEPEKPFQRSSVQWDVNPQPNRYSF